MSKFYYIKIIGDIISNMLALPMLLHLYVYKNLHKKIITLPVKKILFIKMWGIGNIVLLLPILKKVRERYSDSKIYFLTLESNKGFLENSPYLTDVFYFTTNLFKIPIDFLKYVLIVKKLKIDLLLNFEQCNRFSIIFSYLTASESRIGFEIKRCYYNSLYTKTIKNNPELHVSENFTELARRAEIDIHRYKYASPYIDDVSKEKVKKILKEFDLEDKRMVVLHAGCGENFKGKRWKKDNFTMLADKLVETYSIAVVFTGTENEKKLIESIISNMRYKALNLCGKFTLKELAEFLRYCYLFISNDTGPLHIAISLGINTVGLYGPMNPLQYGSLNNNSLSFYKPIGCNPCLTDLNNKTSFCKKSRCLDQITHEEVMKKISTRFFYHEEYLIATCK
jgi:ADP-heptose:LPS heptosyltransferase